MYICIGLGFFGGPGTTHISTYDCPTPDPCCQACHCPPSSSVGDLVLVSCFALLRSSTRWMATTANARSNRCAFHMAHKAGCHTSARGGCPALSLVAAHSSPHQSVSVATSRRREMGSRRKARTGAAILRASGRTWWWRYRRHASRSEWGTKGVKKGKKK